MAVSKNPFGCAICDESFTLAKSLKEHVQKNHSHKEDSKIFAKKSHERLHEGVKLYSCNYCEKTFHNSDAKDSHERRYQR